MKSKLSSLCFATTLVLAACSNGGSTQSEQTGGHVGSGTGGEAQAGGNSGGGKGGSGGTTSAGGTTSNGGTTGAGGSGSGGAPSTGGKTGSGGAGNGGAAGNGGTTSTGGETAAGGVGAGGLTGKGGATGSGGIAGSGGVPGSGGVGATGGTSAKDGGVGGMTGKDGSAGTGGSTTVVISASGYPAAGASGQAQPTGSGTTVTVLPWAGFKNAISFTHDDSNSSQISNYPALQALNDKGNNARFTFYLQTGKSESSNAVWGTAHKDGHELGNHTKSHQSAASASDLDAAEQFIKTTWGVTSYNVAAPNGDASYQTAVPPMKEFLTNRTAGNSGGVAMTDDPSSKQWSLPCIIPATGASASAMESSVTSGTSGGKWNVFLVHGFSGGSDGAYQPVSITEYTTMVTWVKTQGTYWIDTVENVVSYWIGGYRFSKLTATTSGTDKTWTWKTSDFNNPFPPGKYLRVTTNGGVLKQGSTTLQWDDHGYYEVSLDAGTLTLSAQ